MQTKEFADGDILITPGHSLLWVGGDKPLIHNVDMDNTRGVVQESVAGYFGLMNFAKTPTKVRVYRTADADLATRAAAHPGLGDRAGQPGVRPGAGRQGQP